MRLDALAIALWAILLVSPVLTVVGLATRSWPTLLAAALASLAFSVAAVFSIGPLTLLLTCLQLAVAVAFRWSAAWRARMALLALAVLAWALAFPIPLWLDPPTPLPPVIALGMLVAGIVLTIVGPRGRGVARPSGAG